MRKPFVVAIAGGSAAGKSTLAAALEDALRESLTVTRIGMDAFMRRDDPQGPRFFFRHSGGETFDFNHLESADARAILRMIEAAETDVVLVEGLMALADPEIAERADLRLFVELEADVRAVRRMERDLRTGRGGGDPAFIAAYYLESARVGHERYVEPSRRNADFVVRGDGDRSRTVDLLTSMIAARLSS